MSDLESRHEDAKRERWEEKQEAVLPEPCGCEMLSDCCGTLPHQSTPDVTKDNPIGVCCQCLGNISFEPSQIQTWVQTDSDTFGADADGNRGVPMKTFTCTECKAEKEVLYAAI